MPIQDRVQNSTAIKLRLKGKPNTWAIAQKEKPNKRNPAQAQPSN